jgi:DNA-binding LacI/PurR family transcriptional regulator
MDVFGKTVDLGHWGSQEISHLASIPLSGTVYPMSVWQRPSAVSLLATHLRGELERGRWQWRMPGVIRLARELGAARKTVEGALVDLEKEGLLEAQGHGRGRVIAAVKSGKAGPQTGLRVGIFLTDKADMRLDYLLDLRHALAEAGHRVLIAPGQLFVLEMSVERVARVALAMEVDAWLVLAGSREVLEWFAGREVPTMAIFGRRRGLNIASVGPDKPPVMAEATRELVRLGHRRIVLLARRLRRTPQPGASEQAFLDELAAHGIAPGPYHLPDWEETVEGFHARMESLFHVTAPTALIVDEVPLFTAAQQFLASRGIRVPGEVSLLCTDASPDFEWCMPSVAHLRWDSRAVVRRVLKWVDNVSHGKRDMRQTSTAAEFVKGGTIGPLKEMPGPGERGRGA